MSESFWCITERGNILSVLQYDINLGVEYMSFSAHADAKGIMQVLFIRKFIGYHFLTIIG